jgi:hypothetical protein
MYKKQAPLKCVHPRSVSFFGKRWAGNGGQEKTQLGEESLSGQREPQQHRGLIQGSNKRNKQKKFCKKISLLL